MAIPSESVLQLPDSAVILADVRRALEEDIGGGDLTAGLVSELGQSRAEVVCRESGVLAGRAWFDSCFTELDPEARLQWDVNDGQPLEAGQRLVSITGRTRAILSAERSALNFLQTLSATATVTAAWVQQLAGSRTRLLDTRKTLPGLRLAQKYAVRAGGGCNHRFGLYDAILIKENHILGCGSIGAAVARARKLHPEVMVEVEVESFEELDQALAAGVDRVMLDEFPGDRLAEAVQRIDGRCESEISGGVSPEALAIIRASGVDYVSVGAITKHIKALDLSLRIVDSDTSLSDMR